MLKTGRRTHDDVAVSIGLDAIGKPGKHWINQDFIPASQVELRLRSEIWQRDRDRHEVKESMKAASKQRVNWESERSVGGHDAKAEVAQSSFRAAF